MNDEQNENETKNCPQNSSTGLGTPPTMTLLLLLPMIILLLTNPTMTRTVINCFYDLHVPVIKGGTLNVSSGNLQSTPNDDYLFRPWDVWLHDTFVTTSTMNDLEIDNDTARHKNLDIPKEKSRNTVYSSLDDHRLEQRDETTNASGIMCRTCHRGDDTEGVEFKNSTETSLVLEVPPETPP